MPARRSLALLCGLFALSLTLFTGLGLARTTGPGSPAITLLGSGDGLSILVTSQDARVLLVNGDDPAAFGAALASALPRAVRRIDLMLVLATTESEPLVAYAKRTFEIGTVRVVAASAGSGTPTEAGNELSTDRQRIALPDNLSLEITRLDPRETGAHHGITFIVSRNNIRMGMVLDGRDAAMLLPAKSIGHFIVLGDKAAESLMRTDATLLAGPTSELETDEFKSASASRDGPPTVGVSPGAVIVISMRAHGFVLNGLNVPDK